MEVEHLYTFVDFFNEIKTHEKKGSEFVKDFQQIVDELNIVIAYIQQLVSKSEQYNYMQVMLTRSTLSVAKIKNRNLEHLLHSTKYLKILK